MENEPPAGKTCVVSTRRRIPTNWFSGMTLQPSSEPDFLRFYVPRDFLVEIQVSGLGIVPIITLDFISTWIPPFFKRKTLLSGMDGLQLKKEKRRCASTKCRCHWIVEGFGQHYLFYKRCVRHFLELSHTPCALLLTPRRQLHEQIYNDLFLEFFGGFMTLLRLC